MALAELPLSVQKVQALFHFLHSAKSNFQCLTARMLKGVHAFSKLNPALALIAIYAICTGAGFIMWMAMGFVDLAAGTHFLEALLIVMEGLNASVLPVLQLLNGLLALLVGFSLLLGQISININVNSSRSRPNSRKMSTLLLRFKMIGALPNVKYGSLRRRSVDANTNDSCAICLGCIGEEDGVRILPNCRHYFHISCIDRWLLQCPTNSSCPLCRASVIGLNSSQTE